MDTYARCGKIDQVESVFENMENPGVVEYGVLIKAYGNAGKFNRATEVLQQLLLESRVPPVVDLFTSLIDAWADSSQPDAAEQAFAIMRMMEEDEKCVELGVRPNVVTFSALLKCLAASTSSDACIKAEAVLDDMEGRYCAGDTRAKPNQISYTLAMKACFRAGDLARADAIMRRMEASDTPPDLRTYSGILQHYSQLGTPATAERTEQILAYMKELAKTNPLLQPNVFAYTIVLNAWAGSGDPNATNRMWKVYEQIKSDGVQMDTVFYDSLLNYLSKSRKRVALQRAVLLLQEMENGKRSDLLPNSRQYTAVINGFINAGDMENATLVLLRSVEAYVNSKNDGAKPFPSTFHLLTMAWIKSGNLVKATLLLEKMQELHETKRLPMGPDLGTFYTLLSCWGQSSHPKKDLYKTKMESKIAALQHGRRALTASPMSDRAIAD
jgi:pentatricopeptide repeat protein